MIREQLDIDDLVEQGKKEAVKTGQPVLISRVLRMPSLNPLSFYQAGKPWFAGQRVYWSTPGQKQVLVGLGAAFHIESEGWDRFNHVEQSWAKIKEQTITAHEIEVLGTGPLLLGGFSFDPERLPSPLWKNYKAASFYLPRFLLTKQEESTYITVNLYLDPHNLPSSEQWDVNEKLQELIEESYNTVQPVQYQFLKIEDGGTRQQWDTDVEEAVAAIKRGHIEKVVLARQVEVEGERPFEAEPILDKLIQQQQASYVFAIEQGKYCFLGATPERLVKKEGSRVVATCLAGSIKRGSTPEEDHLYSEALLKDEKNKIEHEIVVQMVREALDPVCHQLEISTQPILYKTEQIQHLYTPVEGVAKSGTSLLQMVERLHPTPALGGYPKHEALRYIRQIERFDRGWYASPVGWIDQHDNGEFAVGIRSGLLKNGTATLFAGCGLVADSDPSSEFEETQVKLKPMLSALGGMN